MKIHTTHIRIFSRAYVPWQRPIKPKNMMYFDWKSPMETPTFKYHKTAELSYITEPGEFEQALRELKQDVQAEKVPVIAWDQEWVYDPEDKLPDGPVAVTQFASDKRVIVYQHDLQDYQRNFTPTYLSLMSSPSILKLGRAIHGDAAKIIPLYAPVPTKPSTPPSSALQIRGLLDVQSLAEVADFDTWRSKRIALRTLVNHYLRIDLSKDTRQSNWEARPLGEEQLDYAANDVVCCLELFKVICTRAEFDFFGIQACQPFLVRRPTKTIDPLLDADPVVKGDGC